MSNTSKDISELLYVILLLVRELHNIGDLISKAYELPEPARLPEDFDAILEMHKSQKASKDDVEQ